MKIPPIVVVLALLSSTAVAASEAPSPAVRIGAEEIQAAVKAGDSGPLADAVLRVLPVDAKYNVGVSVVRRSQVDGKAPPDAIVHDAVTEVYKIIEGRGVLVTGGTLEAPVPLPADGPIVRQITGPSSRGTGILGGERQSVGPGDIVVIPPNTPHGFVEISTSRIVYSVIRIDGGKVLELKPPAQ